MKRRIYAICIVLSFVFLSVLMSRNQVFALTPTISATATRTSLPGCGTTVVVTSTPTPTFTPTPRVATATATTCGPIYITATPGTPVASGPDLVISSIGYVSSPACANMPKNSVVVTNNGTVAAGTFQVSFSVGGVAQPAQTVTSLGAGQSVTLLFSSASGAGMVATATADSTNVIAETNETNNTSSVTLPVPTQAATCTPTPVITVSTPTPTLTLTRTPTGPACVTATPMNLNTVSPVTSPTNAMTQVITVTLSGGISVTVTSEAGTFTSTTPVNNVFSVTINLVPNSANHLRVQGKIAVGSCTYFTSIATVDKNGNPLTIVQGTVGLTPTPTATISPTPSGNTCAPVNSVIAAPFTFDGAGTLCWQSSNLGTYINTWNTTSVTINGVNISNMYVPAASYPAKIGGFWYVGYSSSVAWGHFEAK